MYTYILFICIIILLCICVHMRIFRRYYIYLFSVCYLYLYFYCYFQTFTFLLFYFCTTIFILFFIILNEHFFQHVVQRKTVQHSTHITHLMPHYLHVITVYSSELNNTASLPMRRSRSVVVASSHAPCSCPCTHTEVC